jgi:hypothetical protein
VNGNNSAEQSPIVSRDRVIDVIRREVRVCVIVERKMTVEALSEASGVGVRTIRTYMANDASEAREPCLSNALSLACVLGSRAVNAILALIGYSGSPLDEPEAIQPMRIVADAIGHLSVISNAAADNNIDHTEEPETTKAADALIATVLPLSSAGRAA